MAREPDTEAALEALFADARSDGPDDALVARVLADAETVQAAEAPVASTADSPAMRSGWITRLVDTLGGWGAVSGITAAGVMGLAVGLSSPVTVADWIGAETLGLESVSYDLTPDLGELWLEGEDV